MDKQQIWDELNELAMSQGFYGRLIRDIYESGRMDEILQELEDKNFRDPLDLILFFES